MLLKLFVLAPLLLLGSLTPPAQDTGGLSVSDFPIVKPGLWEDVITGGGGLEKRIRSCIVDDRAQSEATLRRMPIPRGCKPTKKTHTATTWDIDMVCGVGSASMSGHFRMSMPDDEHVHSVMTVQRSSTPVRVIVNSHFLGADCGKLGPGQSKFIQ